MLPAETCSLAADTDQQSTSAADRRKDAPAADKDDSGDSHEHAGSESHTEPEPEEDLKTSSFHSGMLSPWTADALSEEGSSSAEEVDDRAHSAREVPAVEEAEMSTVKPSIDKLEGVACKRAELHSESDSSSASSASSSDDSSSDSESSISDAELDLEPEPVMEQASEEEKRDPKSPSASVPSLLSCWVLAPIREEEEEEDEAAHSSSAGEDDEDAEAKLKAALKLQCAERGRQARSAYCRRWRATLKLQAWRRGNRQQIQFQHIIHAVLLIQRWFRKQTAPDMVNSKVLLSPVSEIHSSDADMPRRVLLESEPEVDPKALSAVSHLIESIVELPPVFPARIPALEFHHRISYETDKSKRQTPDNEARFWKAASSQPWLSGWFPTLFCHAESGTCLREPCYDDDQKNVAQMTVQSPALDEFLGGKESASTEIYV